MLLAKSSRCFTEPEESFCGNLRVEGEEECDAGLLGSEDTDKCCDENCKLRPNAKCSDKNSPCCIGNNSIVFLFEMENIELQFVLYHCRVQLHEQRCQVPERQLCHLRARGGMHWQTGRVSSF